MCTIIINGEEIEVAPGLNIVSLREYLQLPPSLRVIKLPKRCGYLTQLYRTVSILDSLRVRPDDEFRIEKF